MEGLSSGAPEPLIPQSVIADRALVLVPALRHLPARVLQAMVIGLEAEIDNLAPGRLFAPRGGGGCAVGVTLQVLFPAKYRPGTMRYLRRRRMKKVDADRDLATRFPRLRHLEFAFDSTVRMTKARRPGLDEREVTRAVGLWFSAEAQAELDRRRRAHHATRRDAQLGAPPLLRVGE
jgi:hypothetical protein